MRILHNKERLQRGCIYCENVIPPDSDDEKYRQRMCPYAECPYHELDKVRTYNEYLKKYGTLTFGELLRIMK